MGGRSSPLATPYFVIVEHGGKGAITKILVTGAGGFIGHHLVARLKRNGHWVRGADLTPPAYEASAADEFIEADLRRWENCLEVTVGVDEVYALAADMGG